MPICFVSLIYLYETGLEKIDELPEETLNNLLEAREAEIRNTMELQFVLSYLGNISKEDSDNMTPFELKNWYELLKKQKALENERNSQN